jgi:Mn2+/Fe2+ NRAMP family transporter
LALIVIGGGFVLIPGAPLVAIIFDSQVLNGVLLPIILVLMLLLINRPRLMGRYVNNLAFNTIAWATVVIVGLLTVVSTIQTILAGNGAGG